MRTRSRRNSLFKALQARPGLTSFLHVDEGDVRSVAFSPDGKTLAAGYNGRYGGGVVLWDVAGRKRLADAPLPVKEGDVSSVAFSPDGKTLAAGYQRRRRRRGGAVGRGRTQAPGRRPPPREGGRRSERGLQPRRQDPRGRIRRVASDDGGGVVLWDVAARKRLVDDPLPVKEGDVVERGLQPRRQDPRGRIRSTTAAAAAVWCCGTWPAASGWSTTRSP